MSALSIQPTFPIFTDIDGQPLEDGYIFIGAANLNPQTNPIIVYQNAALTTVAVQPIRTRGGYPVFSGTPGRLYVNSDYSIQVQNKNGSVVYSAPAATERYSDIVISAVNADDVIYDPAGTGAVQQTAQKVFRRSINVAEYGAVGNGVTDDTAAINNAINAAHANGGGFVTFEPKTYAIQTTVKIRSNVTLDLCGATLQRIGANKTFNIVQNFTYNPGVGIDTNIGIINGTISGNVTNDVATQDHIAGAGNIFLYGVSIFRIENIRLLAANSNGFGWRECSNGFVSHVTGGTFGANLFAPTSGLNNYVSNCDFAYAGATGASPGVCVDIEPNGVTEIAGIYFNNCRINDLVLVDFWQSPGGLFIIEAQFDNCTFVGGSPYTIKITAANSVNANNVIFGDTCRIGLTVSSASALQIGNVNGVICNSQFANDSGAVGSSRAIQTTSALSNFTFGGSTRAGAFLFANDIDSSAFTISSSFFNGVNFATVYLRGSNNIFQACSIASLTIANVASTGNVFTIGTQINSAINLVGGALESNQVINKTNYDILLNGHLPNVTSNGRIVKFSGRDLSATTIGLGRIQFIPPAFPSSGAEIVGRQNGGSDNGEIQIFVSNGGGARFEAARWDLNGNYHPGADNSFNLGTAAFRWKEVFAVAPVINTSDAREKQQFSDIPAEWLDAWDGVKWQRFKWNEAVESKGNDNARWHVGLVAQQIKEAFEAKGLDPFKIGLLCYDEWDEMLVPVFAKRKVWNEELQEELDEEYDTGERVVELQAGNRYGVRYTECAAMEAAWVRRKLESLA
jgi:hypothetical protein